jgi:hypothetical protein
MKMTSDATMRRWPDLAVGSRCEIQLAPCRRSGKSPVLFQPAQQQRALLGGKPFARDALFALGVFAASNQLNQIQAGRLVFSFN